MAPEAEMKSKWSFLLAMVALTAVSYAQIGWTELPVNGSYNGTWPNISQYNWIVYEPSLQKIFTRARLNSCGQPFTNSDWLYDIPSNSFTRTGWSGGGALVDKKCVSPITLPNPSFSYPGDRHPFHQVAYLNGKVYMVDGVEDRGNCTGVIPGTCTYRDLWAWDDSAQTWSQLATPPFKDVEGVFVAAPDFNQLYLFGGLVSGTKSNAVAVYDVGSNTWKKLAPTGAIPPPLDAPTGVYHPLAKKLVFWGGQYGPNINKTYTNQIFVFDPATGAFSQPTMTNPAPGDKFGALDYDSRRNLLVLYDKVDFEVYTYSLELNLWTDTGIAGGPPLTTSSPLQSVSMVYDPVSDTHIAFSVARGDVWQLKLP